LGSDKAQNLAWLMRCSTLSTFGILVCIRYPITYPYALSIFDVTIPPLLFILYFVISFRSAGHFVAHPHIALHFRFK
jgi:hypothetical protein